MRSLPLQALVRRVDLFTLKLFLAAVEEGQLARAAFREHLAASAATKRIQELEDFIGLKLFDRTAKGVVPSPVGRVVEKHARAILGSLDDLRRELGEFAEGIRGHVGVAATGMLIVQFLAEEIGDFTRRFPLVEVEVRQEPNPEVLRALLSGEVDFAVFCHEPGTDYAGIESIECRNDRLVAIAPTGHPLAAAASVSLETLLDQELIMLRENTTVMTNLRHAAKQIRRQPRVKLSVTTADVALSLVAAGMGITLLPASLPLGAERERLTLIPVEGDWAERSYRIGKLAGKPLTPAADALLDQIAPTSLAAGAR